MSDCLHRNIAQDPMGGDWCQDCGAVKPPYSNWMGVIFGQEPDHETPVEWKQPARPAIISFTLPSNGERWNWPLKSENDLAAFVEILDRANIAYTVTDTP